MKDPRHLNKNGYNQSLAASWNWYRDELKKGTDAVSIGTLETAWTWMKEVVQAQGTVFVAGNGGSAALAEHLSCDWMKGTFHADYPVVKVHSLVSNAALLTALGNDFGYDHIFSKQLQYSAKKNDLVILISSSGNSPNIVAACETAKSLGCKVIGYSGFTGGKLHELANLSIHVPVHNYAVVEDAHQMIFQFLAQRLAHERDSRS